jgi:hypothetical protein
MKLIKFFFVAVVELSVALLGGLAVASGLSYLFVALGGKLPSDNQFRFAFITVGLISFAAIAQIFLRRARKRARRPDQSMH